MLLLIGDAFLIQAVQKAKEKKETAEGGTCESSFKPDCQQPDSVLCTLI